MVDLLTKLKNLRRPRILIHAARIGARQYERGRHLTAILGLAAPNKSGAAIMKLLELEDEINSARMSSSAGYSAARHIEILIAVMGEARLLQDAP